MSSLLASAASTFRAVREQLAPLPTTSKFLEQGTLTPDEFILAGDLLVQKCPTWQWSSGLASKKKDHLPAGKQYLVTRNVPCLRRARDLELEGAERMLNIEGEEAQAGEGEENWVETHVGHKTEREVGEMEEPEELPALASLTMKPNEETERPDDDAIPDMDEEDLLAADAGVVEVVDPGALVSTAKGADENILRTRTYDISITYDKYYQTPRLWLSGFSESRSPLAPQAIFEDISQDHARKTVTIEPHPHETMQSASIHPCRHAGVMKRLMEMMGENSKEGLRVDLYLLVFLKFMSSVLPTIDYDYTMSM